MRTCRRQLIDAFLSGAQRNFGETVLDIGGKKLGKRGNFRPPEDKGASWLYLNIDAGSNPDFLARAESIPLADGSIDTFLMCEVLEHLENPDACLAEASRVLRSGGYGIITVPFLYPIHADPYDFQRWTDTRLTAALSKVGLNLVELKPMGGPLAVMTDIVQIRLGEIPVTSRLRRLFGFALLSLFKRVFLPESGKPHSRITTGFGIIVCKPKNRKESS